MAFSGFGPDTRKFLKGLERNNDKEWFEAHRDDYKAHYVAPALEFIAAMGDKLTAVDPDISALPKVNGSLFRINRDIRFSKDKTPYKPHIDLWFWHGADKKAGYSGFFFRMHHDRLLLGAGIHGFEKAALASFREAVAGDPGAELAKITAKLAKAGYDVGGESYKKVPRGYDPEHPRADLLRHGAMHAGIEMKMPAEAASAKLTTLALRHYRKLAPLHHWLVAHH